MYRNTGRLCEVGLLLLIAAKFATYKLRLHKMCILVKILFKEAQLKKILSRFRMMTHTG